MEPKNPAGQVPAQGQISQTGGAQDAPENAAETLDALLAEIQGDPAKAAATIRKLRSENAERRKTAQELEAFKTKALELEADQRKREETALAEQGKWKELAETRARELEQSKATAENLKVYREALETMLQRRKEAVPESLRKRIPDLGDAIKTLEWMDMNADLLSESRSAPNLDANAGKNGDAGEAAKRNFLNNPKPLVRL